MRPSTSKLASWVLRSGGLVPAAKYPLTLYALAALSGLWPATAARAAEQVIVSKAVVRDDGGNPVHANSGDIIKAGNDWYWFGEDTTEYTWPSATPNSSIWYAEFKGVNAYRSNDLVHWTFSNVVLKKQKTGEVGPNREVSRPHVVFNAKTQKWVMLFHSENLGYDENMIGVATSSAVDGDYSFVKKFRPGGERSFDLGVYQEETDCYVIYSWNNSGVRIDKLTDDYMDVAAIVFRINESGEAPVIFKKDGTYYWAGSELSGWSPNSNFYRTAPSLAGPWTDKQKLAPQSDDTFGSQVYEVLTINPGTVDGTNPGYVFVGDLFDLGHFENSHTLWLPLKFTAGDHVELRWTDSWKVDVPVVAPVADAGEVSDAQVPPVDAFHGSEFGSDRPADRTSPQGDGNRPNAVEDAARAGSQSLRPSATDEGCSCRAVNATRMEGRAWLAALMATGMALIRRRLKRVQHAFRRGTGATRVRSGPMAIR